MSLPDFAAVDADGDNRIDGMELGNADGDTAQIEIYDADGDGELGEDEYNALQQNRQAPAADAAASGVSNTGSAADAEGAGADAESGDDSGG